MFISKQNKVLFTIQITLHQQKFWWFRDFLIRCGFRDIFKKRPNETTIRFLVGNGKINILTNQG